MRKGIAAIAAVCLLTGCGTAQEETIKPETRKSDMSGYRFLEDDDPAFETVTFAETVRYLEAGGSGVFLFSEDSCEWCNRAVPVLNEAAKEAGTIIYYVDMNGDDMYELTQEEGDALFARLVETLKDALPLETNPLNGKYEHVLKMPLVCAVVDGKVRASHIGLVSSFEMTDENARLTPEEEEELKEIYLGIIYCLKQ